MLLLKEYAKQFIGVPFEWGVSDCGCFVDGWIENLTGRGILEGLTLTKEQDMANYGGFRRLASSVCRQAGLRYVHPEMAKEGDVGVVYAGHRLMSAIKANKGWVMRIDGGVSYADCRCVAAWRVD